MKLIAASHVARIEVIDYPASMNEDILVFLSTGKVVKLAQNKNDLLTLLQQHEKTGEWLKLDLDEFRFIQKINRHDLKRSRYETNKVFQDTYSDTYLPSVLKSLDWAKSYFKESRVKDKESQCFNRAHVWAYEWYKKHSFNSSKIFIFFTRKYIREHNFQWWFHVSPFVNVNINGQVRERVMDKKYTSGPSMIKDWIQRFVKVPTPGCLTVQTYSDYANFPENGSCYIMKTSMYYYWPLDLENEELHGTIKTSWVNEEIKTAYEEAFDIKK